MGALLAAAFDLDCRARLIFAAEADHRRSQEDEDDEFWYREQGWAVARHKFTAGRACCSWPQKCMT